MADGLQFREQRWSLAIFSSREEPSRLIEAVTAAANADRAGAELSIDVLVNGNATLAAETRLRLACGTWWKGQTTVRLWFLPQPDKAHAWNHYLHTLMPETSVAFFLDGYVKIESDALVQMAATMRQRPQALGATSVPSCGRSSAALRRLYIEEGGLHGNFFALSGATARRLRSNRHSAAARHLPQRLCARRGAGIRPRSGAQPLVVGPHRRGGGRAV